jgi:hypothetical protein
MVKREEHSFASVANSYPPPQRTVSVVPLAKRQLMA